MQASLSSRSILVVSFIRWLLALDRGISPTD